MRHGNFSVLIPQGVEKESGYVRLAHDTPYTIRLLNHHHTPCDAEVSVDGRPIGKFRVAQGGRVEVETPADDPGHGRLTFYRADTPEGQVAQGGVAEETDRGLVTVVFRPGHLKPVVRPVRPVEAPVYPYYGDPTAPWRSPSPHPSWTSGEQRGDAAKMVRDMQTGGGMLRSAGPEMQMFACPTPPVTSEFSRAAEIEANTPITAGVTGLSGTSDQRWQTVQDLDYLPGQEVTIHLRLVAVPKEALVRAVPGRSTPIPPPVSA